MPDDPSKAPTPAPEPGTTPGPTADDEPSASAGAGPAAATPDAEQTGDRSDRGITDFVRRALSAGVGAASRSKDDLMRAAAGEVRVWLDHLNLNDEIARVLAKMVIEVKTEIRFRPSDDGKLVPEATNDFKVKGSR